MARLPKDAKNRARLFMKSPVSAFVTSSTGPVPAGRSEGLSTPTLRVEKTTAIAKARRELEENEERLRLAEAAGQIGTWEWDPEHDTRALSAELL